MSFFLCGFTCFLLSLLFTKGWIVYSRKRAAYQAIREEGPQEHLQSKKQTPTMGGIALLLSVLIGTFPYWDSKLWVALATFLACGFVGFLDDWLKVFRGKNLGLKARHKLFGQLLIGVGLWYLLERTSPVHRLAIPFLNSWDASRVFPLLVVVVLVATTNAVNLTDGLDGLASGVTLTSLFFFFMVSVFLSASTSETYFSVALIGGLLGFLWYNGHPAKVFMGDVGSLALGGALCVLAFQSGLVFWLPIVGGIFVIETLSVMSQVIYFKLTKGKRLFRMSPLHHHFELSGIPETQVTLRFWIISAFLCWFSILGVLN